MQVQGQGLKTEILRVAQNDKREGLRARAGISGFDCTQKNERGKGNPAKGEEYVTPTSKRSDSD